MFINDPPINYSMRMCTYRVCRLTKLRNALGSICLMLLNDRFLKKNGNHEFCSLKLLEYSVAMIHEFIIEKGGSSKMTNTHQNTGYQVRLISQLKKGWGGERAFVRTRAGKKHYFLDGYRMQTVQ